MLGPREGVGGQELQELQEMKRAADVLYSFVGLRFLLASALLIFEHATKPADFIVASVFFGAQEHLVETIGLGNNVQ
jgi:hypothetical protein